MVLAMNVSSLETGNSLDPREGSQGSGLPQNFEYIVGGVAAAVGLVVVVVVMMGLLVWRPRRLRRRNRMEDAEAAQGKGDRIYDEIAEDKGTKKKKKKEKKKKGKKSKEKQSSHDADNNNDMVGMELGAIDTAPDIITAHDNESIYETLDGRRAARAKAGHMTKDDQSEDCNVLDNNNPVVSPEFSDAIYDHLHRFKEPKFPRMPPDVPEKRFTDPEVTTRTKPPGKPRAVHSADCVTRGGKVRADTAKGNCEDKRVLSTRERLGSSPAESPSGSLRSSLTELARQSVSGGKRIVCQLTMVGVVENGKPVPIRPAAASNAYFILEPGNDSSELAEEGDPRSPAPKFRIKSEVSTEDEHGGGGGSAAAGASDYFILEPLSQQDDLDDFVDTAFSRASLNGAIDLTQDADLSDDSRGSLHSHRSLGSVQESRRQRRQSSFRNTRVKSCPEDCSFTEDNDDTLSCKNNYGRSFSSPQSSKYRRYNRKDSAAQIKMDADILNARVRQAMIALFSDDSDEPEQSDVENEDETLPDEESENPEVISCSPRSPRNNYFELESQPDEAEDDNTTESSTQQSVLPESCGMVDGQRSRYYQRRQPPSSSPPPLPKRNRQNRSKSETRTPVVLYGQSAQQSRDQGPVIVSLKKHRALDEDEAGRVEDPSRDGVAVPEEAFRPRFKSESGVLSERLGRC